jgi:hypothetical protein
MLGTCVYRRLAPSALGVDEPSWFIVAAADGLGREEVGCGVGSR